MGVGQNPVTLVDPLKCTIMYYFSSRDVNRSHGLQGEVLTHSEMENATECNRSCLCSFSCFVRYLRKRNVETSQFVEDHLPFIGSSAPERGSPKRLSGSGGNVLESPGMFVTCPGVLPQIIHGNVGGMAPCLQCWGFRLPGSIHGGSRWDMAGGP